MQTLLTITLQIKDKGWRNTTLPSLPLTSPSFNSYMPWKVASTDGGVDSETNLMSTLHIAFQVNAEIDGMANSLSQARYIGGGRPYRWRDDRDEVFPFTGASSIVTTTAT